MAVTFAEMTNISNNIKQEFKFEDDIITLEFKHDLGRWVIGVVGKIANRIVTSGTELLREYNLGYYFVCKSEKVFDIEVGAYNTGAFTLDGNSKLYLVTEDD